MENHAEERKLVQIAFAHSEGGMAKDSYRSEKLSLSWKNDEIILEVEDGSSPFQSVIRTYAPDASHRETAAELEKLVEERKIASFEGLTGDVPYIQMTDYNAASVLTLSYQDEKGKDLPSVSVKAYVLRTCGENNTLDRIIELLESCREGAKLILEKQFPDNNIPLMGMVMTGNPVQEEKVSKGGVCPYCGHSGNTGKYCSECGKRLIDEDGDQV